jgi:hypothetical protein
MRTNGLEREVPKTYRLPVAMSSLSICPYVWAKRRPQKGHWKAENSTIEQALTAIAERRPLDCRPCSNMRVPDGVIQLGIAALKRAP